jgi:hypothetical protein
MDLFDTLIWAEILVKTTFLGTPTLTVYVVNFFETFSTPYFNSSKQDPTIESQK